MYKTVSTALQSKQVKLLIPVLILGSLVFAAWTNIHSFEFISWRSLSNNAFALCVIVFLTFANLYFEMRKWTTLINSPVVNHKSAFTGILLGMCSGFVTPNRLGEFAGRTAALPAVARKKGSLMTFAGSGIQGSVTFIAGIAGLLYYPILPQIQSWSQFMPGIYYALAAMAIVILVLLWFKKPLKPHISAVIKHLKSIKPNVLVKAWLWALGRYTIFSTQFVIALYCVGFTGDILLCYTGVFLLYFCQSYLPFTAMGELGVREVLAIFIFNSFMPEPVFAAVASLIVWIANIGIPVLMGVIKLKFKPEIIGKN